MSYLLAFLAALLGFGPTPIGAGPRYHPAPAAHASTGLRCSQRDGRRYGIHLELFDRRRAVVVPAGIGIAPPLRRDGAYVRGGRCSLPVRTREPTGVIEVLPGRHVTLGTFFRVWGRPLPSGTRAYVAGRLRRGDPRSIPLGPHAQIVLETGGYVVPHAVYRFPKGL